ncbi:hypothetical protein SAMN07250955_1015 [Arboricoccus pini]|uniref:Sugar kinase n=1 Tax=Arboricoccus pini TaxID=1963835 RepID=A0A212PVH5_9PROT|nr:sugar kinase [Arboricoccus pini]SNB50951.1 hypothetical protein SAMN07250955_1015 [Arboricoccus pini]
MEPLQRQIVLVVRETRLEELIRRFNTAGQARFYIEHLGADFSDYEAEHRRYLEATRSVEETLRRYARVQKLERRYLANFIFPPEALVVVLGQDGLVANTLKYVGAQPVIGVNPDPERWDGALLPFKVGDLNKIVPLAQAGKRPTRRITMAAARLADGQVIHAVNDLFIGPRSHVSARYSIRIGERVEQHSSSGLIVSTGLGSTGWFKSVLAGAAGIADAHMSAAHAKLREQGFAWESAFLYFTVREPFPSRTTQASLTFGQITPEKPLELTSQMPDYGVIFSDGIETDRLEFNAGMTASITVADRFGTLLE